jgi:hypothetical protein
LAALPAAAAVLAAVLPQQLESQQAASLPFAILMARSAYLVRTAS